jgi:hypothetical protein
MDAREMARTNGFGRIALGAGLTLAPALAARAWVGSDATSTGAKVLASALGARDVALGLGVVLALKNDAPARGWMEGAALADAVDFAATALAGSGIPKASRWGIMARAGASAVQCAVIARTVDG